MELILPILSLIAGLILLVCGANYFVEGASSVAKLLRVPSVIIGLTVVAMGTSLPEAATNLVASLRGSNGLVLGNIIGSNIFNLAFILGVCTLVRKFAVKRAKFQKDYLCMLAVTLLLLIMLITGEGVSRLEAAGLMLIFAYFLYYVIAAARKNPAPAEVVKVRPWGISLLLIGGGLAGVVKGGELVVESAVQLAQSFGLSDSFIGLTIIAAGTSLPELVTSVMAVLKGDHEIALGNVIGSNIFNIAFILGLSGLIRPIGWEQHALYDLLCLVAMSLVLGWIGLVRKRWGRLEGVVFVGMYLLYMVYICLRLSFKW